MEPRPHLKMLPALVLLVAITAIAILVTLPPGAEAATIVVPDDYGTIQLAIDNAAAGDMVRVHAGSYSESISVHTRVAIIGNGTGETLISSSAPDAVDMSADGSSISKVRIEGGGTSGIVVRGSDCVVEDVHVTGSSRGLRTNGADGLYVGNSTFVDNSDFGMIIHLSNNVTVYGCNVSANLFDDGIQVNAGPSDITISHTIVDGNGYYGIEFLGNTNITVDNCTVTNNLDNGIYAESSQRLVFSDNNISWNSLFGVYAIFCQDIEASNNLVSYNLFGLYMDNSDDGDIMGNRVLGNDGVGISLFDSGGTIPFMVHHNRVEGNALTFGGLEAGIFVGGFSNADGNFIEDNELVGNHNGLVMRYSGAKDNVVRRNLIDGNSIGLQNANTAGGNRYYHNNFVGNTVTIQAPSALDKYDSGYPNGGNYWDAYKGTDGHGGPAQDVMGPDGLGDTAFAITTTISDRYPLVRMFGDNPLASVAIVAPASGDIVVGTVLAEAVVTGDIVSVVEWYLDDVLVGSDSTEPYQLVLDTTTLVDVTHHLNATAYLRLTGPITDSISITPNNVPDDGPPFNITTVSTSYTPDDQVTAIVSFEGNLWYEWAEIEVRYEDADLTNVFLPSMVSRSLNEHGFTFRLPSDVAVGNVTVYATVKAYWRTSLIWTSQNSTEFAVEGTSQSERMADLLDQLNGILAEIDGLNVTNRAERAAALADILDGLGGLDADLQARMDGLEGSIANNATALQEFIDLQTQQVQMYMVALNASLSEQMAGIELLLTEFRVEAGDDLDGVAAYLREMEANGSARHGEVLEAMDETYALLEDVNATTLEDLRARLAALSDDLEELDDAEAIRHQNTVDVMVMELDGLSKEVTDGFNATEAQLGALSKLDDILDKLDALSEDVADVQDTAGGGVSSWNMLLILAFGIITVLLLAILLIRLRELAYSQPPPPREPEPLVERPGPTPAEKEPRDTSFELMMEEPEMYMREPPEPSVEVPEEPPEVPPETPPDLPPPPSFPEEAEAPQEVEIVEEGPPTEIELLEEVPPESVPGPPTEVPPPPVPPPPPDVPPPEVAETVSEPVDAAPEGFELEPIPEPVSEEVPSEQLAEEPVDEVPEEPPEEPPEEAPEEPQEEPPEEGWPPEDEESKDEEPREGPRGRKKSAQEWVIDEIMEEI